MLRSFGILTGLLLAAGLTVAGLPGVAQGKPRLDCSTAAGKFGRTVGYPTTVTSATTGATAATTSYCDVRASITVGADDGTTSLIQLRPQVPADWNHRYVQLGGGGFCGSIPTAGTSGDGTVDLGYAVASDDTDHVGGGSDASFALDNTAAQNTWGYLSEHLTALMAKAILKGVTRSSSPGCSCCPASTTARAGPAPTGSTGSVRSAPGPSAARP